MRFEKSRRMQMVARNMRNNPTKEENHLWYDFLSRYPVRFNRQKNIGCYVVDFYCHKASLVIEIYGEGHDEQYSRSKEEYVASYGLKVICFEKRQIRNDFLHVCRTIDKIVRERI